MKPCENQIDIFCGSQKLKTTKPVRLIELFAGIGAQAKALKNLNISFEHYRVCEIDKYAVKSYNAIHNTNFQPTDITKLSSFDLGITDTDKYTYIMTYSFPCQDLSAAGKQRGMEKGSGTRSGLLWEVERLLTECKEKPQILLMENVPQVIGKKNIKHFAEWLKFLDDLGYKSKYQLLNAKNYGIPQNRSRCFMVSWLGDFYYEFPKPFELKLRLGDMLEEKVSKKYFISIKNKRIENLVKEVANKQISKTVRVGGRRSLDKHSWDVVYGINANQSESFRRSGLESLARCLKSEQLDGACTNGEWARYYTPLETCRLMGFSDNDFQKAKTSGVSDTQLYKQAGNSIVVPVLENIFKKMELI